MIKYRCHAACRVLLGASLLLAATFAQAQATRTWVSGVGDDANPCSRTAPCKTFAGAISKTAINGIISVLDPGGFGAVTITKSITIDGGGIEGSILASGTTGVLVNITAGGDPGIVTLRNLSISGVTTGIYGIRFVAGTALHVENVHISGFSSSSAGTGWGILVNPATAGIRRLYVQDSTIQDNGSTGAGGGIQVTPTGPGGFLYAAIENTHITNNAGNGVFVGPNGFVTINHSNISGNRLAGVHVTAPTKWAEVVIHDSMISDSGSSDGQAALQADGVNGYLHLSGNVIANNNLAVLTTNGGHINTSDDNQAVNNTVNGSPTGTDPNF